MLDPEILPETYAKIRLEPNAPLLLDVREPWEVATAAIPNATSIPMGEITSRAFTELDPDRQYYLHCKAGVRSLKAVYFLRQQGFKHVKSVRGGIAAWSDEIDDSVPRY